MAVAVPNVLVAHHTYNKKERTTCGQMPMQVALFNKLRFSFLHRKDGKHKL